MFWVNECDEINKTVMLQEAASPTCHPSWLQMDLSDLDPMLIFRSTLWQSRPNKAGLKCPSVRLFVHLSTKCLFSFNCHVNFAETSVVKSQLSVLYGAKFCINVIFRIVHCTISKILSLISQNSWTSTPLFKCLTDYKETSETREAGLVASHEESGQGRGHALLG